ncbi:MAG: hypothetical protein PHQ12_02130 [Chthoniobacteraceae bacterium]|nr:hypothetical protein [Chthoniobacteraceae bacterium]
MKSHEQTFWRLFGSYEDLTRHQTAAIGEWNTAVLRSIEGKKAAILKELTRLGLLLGLDRGHPALNERLTALIAAERRNAALASENLAKARLETHLLNAATKRLRAVENVYAGSARREHLAGAFYANG